jgi:hypothetical protein
VTGGVGVDPQPFLGVVRPVEEDAGAQVEGAPVLVGELGDVRHRGVQVQLLRDRRVGPRGRGERVDLLERELDPARAAEDQPVGAAWVGLAGGRGLVALPVVQAEQPPVELRQRAGVGGVEDGLPDRGVGVAHGSSGNPSAMARSRAVYAG